MTINNLRCVCCGKLLAEQITPPYRITCRGCKTVNLQAPVKQPILAQ